jgi:hypothetical protein
MRIVIGRGANLLFDVFFYCHTLGWKLITILSINLLLTYFIFFVPGSGSLPEPA